MYIEQMYTGCLAEAAYYIESNGEAAIIDPLRETAPYLEKASERNAKIKYIFETHFHADFVSGHLDLAKKTGATIVYGPTAKTEYNIHVAEDGETFGLGNVKIKVLHTPGHTLESSTFLLIDEKGKNHAIFTGDTLFIGDVGRPDLAVKGDLSKEDLASMLYDSLRNKIIPLEDNVIVYPAHGAGSACGKNMSEETYSTLGEQKKNNYALRATDKATFIKEVTEGILPPPQYFAKNAAINKKGYGSIDEVLTKGLKALTVDELEEEMDNDTLVLDTRHQQTFAKGFIPGTINIPLDGSFAVWVGTLITDINQRIIVIAEAGREEEAVTRLARVGYDNTIGYLKGGFKAWKAAGKSVDTIESIQAGEFEKRLKEGQLTVLDVRKPTEYQSEHVKEAKNFPLDFVNERMNELDKDETYYIYCRSGYRSMVTSSVLKKNGFKNVIDINGGFRAIETRGIPKTDYVCPTTL